MERFTSHRYLNTLNIDKDILSMKNFNVYDPMRRGQGLVLDGQTLAHIEVRGHPRMVVSTADVNFRCWSTTRGPRTGRSSSCSRVVSRRQVYRFCPRYACLLTCLGKRLFRIWLCMPLREVADINARYVRRSLFSVRNSHLNNLEARRCPRSTRPRNV